ncbi:hypothetical protein ACIA5D_06575 [Actinoplanes sp. NPDC051513]|uniref:hypothetical protein n=1 Tax=Actinoplanes sp. NPDC051513 TaxID=3363908 RepID=UPI00378E9D68
MRKLLLWMGTMWVGMVTLIVVLFMFTGASSAGANGGSGSGGAILGSVVLWLFSLAGGLALSAPAFLNPPDDNGGIWAFRLPLPLWLFLMMMKLTSWVGFYILLGTWMLIFKVGNTHQNNKLPTFSNQPQPAYATQQPFGGPQFPPQPQFPP